MTTTSLTESSAPQKPRRPQRSPRQWAKIISDWQSSGLSARQYAWQHDLGVKSLYDWKMYFAQSEHNNHRMRTATRKNDAPMLLPLRISETKKNVTPGDLEWGTSALVVRLPNGVSLELKGNVER